MNKYYIILILWSLFSSLYAEDTLSIRVLHKINRVGVKLLDNTAEIIGNREYAYAAEDNELVELEAEDGKVCLYQNDLLIDCFKQIDFVGYDGDSEANFQLQDDDKLLGAYLGDLNISVQNEQLMIVNFIDIEEYLQGVIEHEMGYKLTTEAYKVQAVISRTYAKSNKRKHKAEGYDLCNEQHCQVYKGKKTASVNVLQALKQTKNTHLKYKKKYVNTLFSANCGGETCKAEDVWKSNEPYLENKLDSFCLKGKACCWEKQIPKIAFFEALRQLTKEEVEFNTPVNVDISKREKYFVWQDVKVKYADLRTALKLKSAYFSVEQKGDQLVFRGKGFGHGVGLCQEGAIARAKSGQSYVQILKYYYKDVEILRQ